MARASLATKLLPLGPTRNSDFLSRLHVVRERGFTKFEPKLSDFVHVMREVAYRLETINTAFPDRGYLGDELTLLTAMVNANLALLP